MVLDFSTHVRDGKLGAALKPSVRHVRTTMLSMLARSAPPLYIDSRYLAGQQTNKLATECKTCPILDRNRRTDVASANTDPYIPTCSRYALPQLLAVVEEE